MNTSNQSSNDFQDKDPKEALIADLKQTVSLLLFVYAVMAFFLRLFGYGLAVFSFDFFLKDKSRSIELGLLLYYSLPFLVWLYSVKGDEPEGFLRKYAIVEGVNIALGILLKLPMAFFALAFGMVFSGLFMFLGIAILGGVFLTVIAFVMKNVKEIMQLQTDIPENEARVKEEKSEKDSVLTIWGIAFRCLAKEIMQLRVDTPENEGCVKKEKNKKHSAIAMGVVVFCYLAPLLGLNLNGIEQLGTSSIRPYNLKAEIQHMTGSPDGKLLALATKKGVSVWDTDSRECVWSDDAMPVQRVRFSPSGHYLAAVGRNPDRAQSDIAVFEVQNFKRLPGFDLIQEDLSKDKIFHDISFREEEKILSVLWHEDWDWRQMTSDERSDRRRKEDEENKKNEYSGKKELFCGTYSLAGKKLDLKGIRSLLFMELKKGNVGFMPDGRQVLYVTYVPGDLKSNPYRENRFALVDADTRDYRELKLPPNYRIATPSLNREIEWFSDKAGEHIYFSAIFEAINRGSRSFQYVFCKVNLKSGAVTEFYRVSNPFEPGIRSWRRSALSPDEKKAVLLGYFFQPKKKMPLTLIFLDLKGKDPATTITRVIGGTDNFAFEILWLAPDRLAVSLKDAFALVDLKEGKWVFYQMKMQCVMNIIVMIIVISVQ